jgi:multiple antibiotic resistance protein
MITPKLLKIFIDYFLVGVVSLIPIVNPISKIGLFLGLSHAVPDKIAQKQARRACFYGLLIMITSLFLGEIILHTFGISFGALRISGGLTVAILGYRMLYQDTQSITTKPKHNFAFFPLALPGIAGPGTIAAIISLSTEVAEKRKVIDKVAGYAGTVAAMIVTILIVFLTLKSAPKLQKFFGEEGMEALNRLMGFLLFCVGIQLIASGIVTFVKDFV